MVPTHRAEQEPVERKTVTPSLLFLHEKQCMNKRMRKITSGAWGCQSLLFLEALGSSISALCCLLSAHMPWCQSGSQWRNPAPFTCGCCFHPLPRGKWCVPCFGGGFVWFEDICHNMFVLQKASGLKGRVISGDALADCADR